MAAANPVYACDVCDLGATKCCARCKSAVYCSFECATTDWEAHRHICTAQVIAAPLIGADVEQHIRSSLEEKLRDPAVNGQLPTVDLSLTDSPPISAAVSAKNVKKGLHAAHQLLQIWKILSKVFMVVDAILNKKKTGIPLESRDLDNLIKALAPLQSLIPKTR